MASRDPELDALAGELETLLGDGARPDDPVIAQAEDALAAAEQAVARADGTREAALAAQRAIANARQACEKARAAVSGAVEETPAVPSPRRTDVSLESEIPDDHPEKRAIETAVAGAFAGVQGRWKVAILVQEKASWWGLRVEGASVCWTGTLDGPEEQSPDFLAGRVREAVQLGLMQSALDRTRGRERG